MNKPVITQFDVHDLLARRWSPRAFSGKAIEPETVASLFEAARWAPSSRNLQPWRFIVETQANPEGFNKLAQGIMESNRIWAEKAYVLAVIVAERQAPDSERANGSADYDAGLATSLLTVQAMSKDLYVHQMGGIHKDKIIEAYGIPEGYQPMAGLAIGYMGELTDLPESLQERESAARTRKPLEEIIFSDSWGEAKKF